MNPVEQRILGVLQRYVSSMNAQVMLARAMREADVPRTRLADSDLVRVCERLLQGTTLFVDASRRDALRRELEALTQRIATPVEPRFVAIRSEADVTVAVLEARRLCEGCSSSSFLMQKVTTIVSELARNIVTYTPGGTIDLKPTRGAKTMIEICASDSGRGVPDLKLVLSGRYKSTTGMGRGMLGCKRLADTFEVETGPTGTTVRAAVFV